MVREKALKTMREQERHPNHILRRERELRGWSQQTVAERIGTSDQAVNRWENGQHKPNRYFQTQLCELFGKTAETLGFMDKQKKVNETREVPGEKGKGQIFGPSHSYPLSQENGHLKSDQLTYNNTRSLLLLPGLDMLMMSRRQVLKEILNGACAALLLSPYMLLPQDTKERLDIITSHPSYVDEEAINDLATITRSYWTLSKNASIDLLSGVAGHFTTIAQLLKEPHPTPIYEKLCALASENALLLGKTFHDIREYDLAWEYYKFSLKIAQDTLNTDLWANGVGRIALLLIYWGQPQHALPLLHEAQKKEIHNQRLKPWLSAIEAEIHAMRGNIDDCKRSLERAKSVQLPTSLLDDTYATGFNPSRAEGYEGACFVRLHQPDLALPALEKAFSLCDPTSLRRRSTLLADRGTVYAQLGDVQTACSLILQALDMTAQTKSLVVLQRIYKGREVLDPWKGHPEVKILDERIFEMLTTLTKLKEQAHA
jgi:transcriptional regulator with XRE-family HTH domain/tetratricopeptide (TPR) repeat protein